ncbi:uncharacterized protein ACNS7B_016194 [Menidia menidia]
MGAVEVLVLCVLTVWLKQGSSLPIVKRAASAQTHWMSQNGMSYDDSLKRSLGLVQSMDSMLVKRVKEVQVESNEVEAKASEGNMRIKILLTGLQQLKEKNVSCDNQTAVAADNQTAVAADNQTAVAADNQTAVAADNQTAVAADNQTAVAADNQTAVAADNQTAVAADNQTADEEYEETMSAAFTKGNSGRPMESVAGQQQEGPSTSTAQKDAQETTEAHSVKFIQATGRKELQRHLDDKIIEPVQVAE